MEAAFRIFCIAQIFGHKESNFALAVSDGLVDRYGRRNSGALFDLFLCHHADCCILSGIPTDAVLSYLSARYSAASDAQIQQPSARRNLTSLAHFLFSMSVSQHITTTVGTRPGPVVYATRGALCSVGRVVGSVSASACLVDEWPKAVGGGESRCA